MEINITGMFIVIFSILLIISSLILFSEMIATRVFTIFLFIFTISGSWRFSYLYRQNNYAVMAVFILFNYMYYGIVLGLSFQIINNSIKEFKNLNSKGLLLRGSVLAILCILGNIYYKQVVVFTGF
ncbi:hypothetical protein Clos_2239 [Alkaliphilus oremlandii OhILAs]|uniref:Uncharacterized protein n=1 Tax=Alkaliphilus oremlandii (strain OhILAs) TaxID=350688 RepID=A8MIZ2_ALKOO|nr:hypothetical protein Clos_2239 [Alkaliphilus oremlandii OhILAs]